MSIVLFDAHRGEMIILCMDIKVNNQLLTSNTVCLFKVLASNPYIKQIPKITKVIIPLTEAVQAMYCTVNNS